MPNFGECNIPQGQRKKWNCMNFKAVQPFMGLKIIVWNEWHSENLIKQGYLIISVGLSSNPKHKNPKI